MRVSDVIDEGRIAAGGVRDFAAGLVSPAVRLGVTGLARSGKTVFITALIHALLNGARLPAFTAHSRIERAYLEPQPDDDVPRFAYEDHIAALTAEDRRWPESTRRISQLRLTVDYTPRGFFARNLSKGRLHIDIVDYPGEWLLDLPLMAMDYGAWSRSTVAASRKPPRAALARDWHGFMAALDPAAPAEELQAVKASELFTAYLAQGRRSDVSLSTLPPGRFLMPGDLAGSPLLTFAPLDLEAGQAWQRGSLAALMQRRYDSYVRKIVKPFFFDHFARLDRQIVLADALGALNAGAGAVDDLRGALTGVFACFRHGSNGWMSSLFGRRIERIVFAATKADLVHHHDHARLDGILRLLVNDASERAAFAGSDVKALALAAIRATREATVTQAGEPLPCIVGTPEAGETVAGEVFDGHSEAAIFPGDLPDDPRQALSGSLEGDLKFVKFRPPVAAGAAFPHIRLDSALEFLVGDVLA